MSWLRRENESNVDLNRNFLQDEEKYEGSHPHYSKLDKLINTKKLPRRFNLFNLKLFFMDYFMVKLKQSKHMLKVNMIFQKDYILVDLN